MGIIVQWDNPEKTSIRFSVEELWTWEDLSRNSATARSMMSMVNHPVHLIFDMSQTDLVPYGALGCFRAVVETQHPNTGLMVFVGSNVYTRSLITYHMRSSRFEMNNVKHMPNLEAARRLVAMARVPMAV